MFTTGSKLLTGAAVVATLAAIAYGVTQGGSLGTVGLISAAAALAFLAGINIYVRDSDVSAMDTAALTESAAAAPVPGASVWPIVAGLGGALLAVGSVTYPVVFIFGLIAILAATAEWMVQAWSERASADVVFNEGVRERIAHPLEFPVLAAVGTAIVIYSFSRIMLFLSKTSGPAVFAVVAALILAAGFVIALRPTLRAGAIAAVCVVAGLGLVTGGVTAALEGERDLHVIQTTEDLSAAGECETTDETEADEKASQSVAAKANLAAVVTLADDGTLVARNSGVVGDTGTVYITRANPSNVRFVNETEEHRRLVLDMGVRPDVDEATGDSIPDTEVPVQLCTALVEEGGSQLLTFSIPTPSALAATPYRFFVPGVDGAEIEVMVS